MLPRWLGGYILQKPVHPDLYTSQFKAQQTNPKANLFLSSSVKTDSFYSVYMLECLTLYNVKFLSVLCP